MPGNTFGKDFKITTFGESHGSAIGVVIDGCPAGLTVDESLIESELKRRKPGQSNISSPRNESEEYEILSGVFEGITTGSPIAIIIKNKDVRSKDYSALRGAYRPSHADFVYQKKYGIRDHNGGGRASARETACRVLGGSFAKMLLKVHGVSTIGYVSSVGGIKTTKPYSDLDLSEIESNIVRCPESETAQKMITLIEKMRDEGDTIGGEITCVVKGMPVGLGQPVFDKLNADLAKAMLSINACRGFQIGSGFDQSELMGSEMNDQWYIENEEYKTKTNFSGGIQAGISNGQDVYFKVVFKAVSSIKKDQKSVNEHGENIDLKIEGRHDPCVLPRAVPVVEAMTNLVLIDHLMRMKNDTIS